MLLLAATWILIEDSSKITPRVRTSLFDFFSLNRYDAKRNFCRHCTICAPFKHSCARYGRHLQVLYDSQVMCL